MERHDSMFESLEPRLVLAFTWSSEEVYLVELVNRARMDPSSEGLRTGVDLTADLSAGELANLVPSEPLALHESLTLASRQHSLDMAERDFFAHENPDGDKAQQRADDNGYDGSAGENIAAGYDSIYDSHVAWLDSVGHRKNVLSLWTTFNDSFHYDEIGVGFFDPGPFAGYTYQTYHTQVFGHSGLPSRTYVLGVIYDDNDGDDFYSIGEGRADVRINVTDADTGELVGTYLTDEAGNYQIAVPGGDYVVTFVDTLTGIGKQVETTVTYNINNKIDTTGDELTEELPPTNTYAEADARVNASAGAGGVITVTTINGEGHPIAFREAGNGTWEAVDLQTLTGSDDLAGQIETWTDPRDGLTYAAAASDAGLLLFQRTSDGLWTFRNLTDEISGAGLLVGDITVFQSLNSRVFIAGIDAEGDLHLFNQSGPSDDNGYLWTARNLSDTDLADEGKTTPSFAGGLISFVTAWNALNIAGLDTDGNIQAVWIAGRMPRWTVSNLSATTGAPALTGGLTAYLTTWQAINLVGTDASGKVSATWWVPSFGPSWTTSNLTDLFDGPRLIASSMTSFVTSWGATNVAGVDPFGRLTVYWWAPGIEGGRWAISYLSDAIEGAELPFGELRGMTVASTGTINIFGSSSEDDAVLRYWWRPGGQWELQNLTDLTT